MRRHFITPIFSYKIFCSHYLINGTIFGKNLIEHRICLWIISAKFIWNISYSKKNWVRYEQKCIFVFMWSVRYTWLILIKLEFLDIFSKNTQISSFMKICPVAAEFQATNRWADIQTGNLIVAFRKISNAPKTLTYMTFDIDKWG